MRWMVIMTSMLMAGCNYEAIFEVKASQLAGGRDEHIATIKEPVSECSHAGGQSGKIFGSVVFDRCITVDPDDPKKKQRYGFFSVPVVFNGAGVEPSIEIRRRGDRYLVSIPDSIPARYRKSQEDWGALGDDPDLKIAFTLENDGSSPLLVRRNPEWSPALSDNDCILPGSRKTIDLSGLGLQIIKTGQATLFAMTEVRACPKT